MKKLYFTILELLKQGKSTSEIRKTLKITKQNLYYYMRKMRQNGEIRKVSYGAWEVKRSKKPQHRLRSSTKQIRGHAFVWRVLFDREYDWKKFLDRRGIKYQGVGFNKSTPRVMVRGKKVWFTKKGLRIYESNSFFAESSHATRQFAVHELMETIGDIESLIDKKLGGYSFTTSREHYGQIKNELARQYNDKGEKIYIRDNNGIWLWIDDSHSLNELETNEPNVSHQLQKWFNDHKKHKFEVSATFLLESLSLVALNQEQQNNLIKNLYKMNGIDLDAKKNTEIKPQPSTEIKPAPFYVS